MAATVRIPSYGLHKATGRGFVKLKGKYYYLGKHVAPESQEQYRRLVADYLAGRPLPGEVPADGITVADLLDRYEKHAKIYYVKAGRPTSEAASIRCALEYARDQYCVGPATKFDILALRAVRESMVDAGLCRGVVNQNTGRIVWAFRWATTEKLYPGHMLADLQALPGLLKGRSTAREPGPIMPVDDATVAATLQGLNPIVAAMVKLQRATGMRSSEVCCIRPMDIDRTGDVWLYVPHEHKTEHHGKRRTVFIGAIGQAALAPYLLRPADECCFRPKRVTSKLGRYRRYTRNAYALAIKRACLHAKVDHWAPNQLRHSFATEVRRHLGLEAAQVALGHSSASITKVELFHPL